MPKLPENTILPELDNRKKENPQDHGKSFISVKPKMALGIEKQENLSRQLKRIKFQSESPYIKNGLDKSLGIDPDTFYNDLLVDSSIINIILTNFLEKEKAALAMEIAVDSHKADTIVNPMARRDNPYIENIKRKSIEVGSVFQDAAIKQLHT